MKTCGEKQNKFTYMFLLVNVWIITLGSLLFGYWFFLDGEVINRPITMKVDPTNLQVIDKDYRPGDHVILQSAFCKNRNAPASVRWSLVDTIIRFYPEKSIEIPIGCWGTAENPIQFYAVTLPSDIVSGTYHLQAVTRIQVNPIKTMIIEYRSEPFVVQ